MLFGNPQAHKEFAERNPAFIGIIPRLDELTRQTLEGPSLNTQADQVIYGLVLLSVEDFDSVLLEVSNGKTYGAMKALRALFEKVVTAYYIHRHEDEAEAFVAFERVRRYKAIKWMEEFAPGDLERELVEQAKRESDDLVPKLPKSTCDACGAESPSFTWSKRDVISMAKELKAKKPKPNESEQRKAEREERQRKEWEQKGEDFEAVIKWGYYDPIEETHPSPEAIARRIHRDPDGSITYVGDTSHEFERHTLVTAHYLVLRGLRLLIGRFDLDPIDPLFERCEIDHTLTWTAPHSPTRRKAEQRLAELEPTGKAETW